MKGKCKWEGKDAEGREPDQKMCKEVVEKEKEQIGVIVRELE